VSHFSPGLQEVWLVTAQIAGSNGSGFTRSDSMSVEVSDNGRWNRTGNQRVWDNAPMSPSIVAASPKQVAKVLEVLRRSMPKGAMIEQIRDQTGFTNEIIWSAIHALEAEGTVVGRNPFAYDPNAVDPDPNDPEN
jgi:hypothetical protein